jgi:hypothetical protein
MLDRPDFTAWMVSTPLMRKPSRGGRSLISRRGSSAAKSYARPKWSMTYWIVVLDRTGHRIEGLAYATGFIRRKVWVDW